MKLLIKILFIMSCWVIFLHCSSTDHEELSFEPDSVKIIEHQMFLVLHPEDVSTRLLLAELYLAMGFNNETVQECENIISLNHTETKAYVLWGKVLIEMNQWEESLDKFNLAMRINSKIPVVYAWRAEIFSHLKRIKEGDSSIARALELGPEDTEILRIAGRYYMKTKRYEKAVQIYKKCIGINDQETAYLNGIGDAYFSLNDFDNACKFYKKSLEINSWQEDIRKKLNQSTGKN